MRRTLLGMSQDQLGKILDVSYQQIQKYELGANRIGVSRLFQLSMALDVPISFFFDEMPGQLERDMGQSAPAPSAEFDLEDLSSLETLNLVRAYYRVTDPTVRRRILALLQTLGDTQDERPAAGDLIGDRRNGSAPNQG